MSADARIVFLKTISENKTVYPLPMFAEGATLPPLAEKQLRRLCERAEQAMALYWSNPTKDGRLRSISVCGPIFDILEVNGFRPVNIEWLLDRYSPILFG